MGDTVSVTQTRYFVKVYCCKTLLQRKLMKMLRSSTTDNFLSISKFSAFFLVVMDLTRILAFGLSFKCFFKSKTKDGFAQVIENFSTKQINKNNFSLKVLCLNNKNVTFHSTPFMRHGLKWNSNPKTDPDTPNSSNILFLISFFVLRFLFERSL